MKGIRKIIFLTVIFLSTIAVMASAFYSVIMVQLFDTYEAWAMNLAISLPAIAGWIACLAAGKICDRVDKKYVFILGLVLSGITASNLALAPNSIVMIIMSCFNGGFCYGLVSVPAIGIITDCFEDERERGKIMGYYNGAMSLSGAIMVLIYGALAEIDWRLAPVPNWAILLVALAAVFAVPACPPSIDAAQSKGERVKGEKGWAKRLVPILIAFFCTSFAFGSVTHYINLYVTANNMGGAAFTSICTSVQTVCAFGSCLLFGYLHEKLKTRVTIPAYCLVTAGVFLMYFIPVKPVAVFADGIIGIGWGILYTYWFFRSTVVVPHNMVGTATGVVTTTNSLSYFPIPYVVTGAMAAIQTDNFRNILPLYGGIVAVAAVLSIIINLKKRRPVTAEHS